MLVEPNSPPVAVNDSYTVHGYISVSGPGIVANSTRNGGFTDNFNYDSAGNPTSFKGVTKSYNANNQQTGTGFTYDGNGNPTTYGGLTLTFDPENRMTSYSNSFTAGYSGDGLRAWKENSSGRRYFLFDGIIPVVELDSSGAAVATNTFG